MDRFASDPEAAVEVIVPIIHTNELWKANLTSFFREIPIKRLLIGDGGCIDDSVDVAKTFPRVTVLDHRAYSSLGYSIRKLIEEVQTDWFIYVHSDVYLPEGWFDRMRAHQSEFDWFGCRMQHTVMVEYDHGYGDRPWAGSQMGRKKAFEVGLERIEDDYVYRQEDFVFADIVRRGGFREGRVPDVFHFHQTIHKPSPTGRRVKSLGIQMEMTEAEEVRTCLTQVRGLLKYVDPRPELVPAIRVNVQRLEELGEWTWTQMLDWTRTNGPAWLPLLTARERRKFSFWGIRPLLGRAKRRLLGRSL